MNLAFHRREIILSVPAEYRLQQANEGRYAFLLRPLFVAPDHPLPWMISSSSPIQRPQQTRRLLPALLLAQVLALLIAATGVFSEALSHQVTSCPGPVLAECQVYTGVSLLQKAFRSPAFFKILSRLEFTI